MFLYPENIRKATWLWLSVAIIPMNWTLSSSLFASTDEPVIDDHREQKTSMQQINEQINENIRTIKNKFDDIEKLVPSFNNYSSIPLFGSNPKECVDQVIKLWQPFIEELNNGSISCNIYMPQYGDKLHTIYLPLSFGKYSSYVSKTGPKTSDEQNSDDNSKAKKESQEQIQFYLDLIEALKNIYNQLDSLYNKAEFIVNACQHCFPQDSETGPLNWLIWHLMDKRRPELDKNELSGLQEFIQDYDIAVEKVIKENSTLSSDPKWLNLKTMEIARNVLIQYIESQKDQELKKRLYWFYILSSLEQFHKPRSFVDPTLPQLIQNPAILFRFFNLVKEIEDQDKKDQKNLEQKRFKLYQRLQMGGRPLQDILDRIELDFKNSNSSSYFTIGTFLSFLSHDFEQSDVWYFESAVKNWIELFKHLGSDQKLSQDSVEMLIGILQQIQALNNKNNPLEDERIFQITLETIRQICSNEPLRPYEVKRLLQEMPQELVNTHQQPVLSEREEERLDQELNRLNEQQKEIEEALRQIRQIENTLHSLKSLTPSAQMCISEYYYMKPKFPFLKDMLESINQRIQEIERTLQQNKETKKKNVHQEKLMSGVVSILNDQPLWNNFDEDPNAIDFFNSVLVPGMMLRVDRLVDRMNSGDMCLLQLSAFSPFVCNPLVQRYIKTHVPEDHQNTFPDYLGQCRREKEPPIIVVNEVSDQPKMGSKFVGMSPEDCLENFKYVNNNLFYLTEQKDGSKPNPTAFLSLEFPKKSVDSVYISRPCNFSWIQQVFLPWLAERGFLKMSFPVEIRTVENDQMVKMEVSAYNGTVFYPGLGIALVSAWTNGVENKRFVIWTTLDPNSLDQIDVVANFLNDNIVPSLQDQLQSPVYFYPVDDTIQNQQYLFPKTSEQGTDPESLEPNVYRLIMQIIKASPEY